MKIKQLDLFGHEPQPKPRQGICRVCGKALLVGTIGKRCKAKIAAKIKVNEAENKYLKRMLNENL